MSIWICNLCGNGCTLIIQDLCPKELPSCPAIKSGDTSKKPSKWVCVDNGEHS
jgi:hypothetical protein